MPHENCTCAECRILYALGGIGARVDTADALTGMLHVSMTMLAQADDALFDSYTKALAEGRNQMRKEFLAMNESPLAHMTAMGHG